MLEKFVYQRFLARERGVSAKSLENESKSQIKDNFLVREKYPRKGKTFQVKKNLPSNEVTIHLHIVVGALLWEAVFALINFEHSSNLINSVSDIQRIFNFLLFMIYDL